jgi:hypothetical protein
MNSASGIDFIPKQNRGTYIGKSLGGFIKYNLSKQFGVKGFLKYDQNGYKIKDITFADINGNIISNKTNLIIRNTYINIPILAEYSFGEKIKINLNGGPFIGILLSSFLITNINAVAANGDQFPNKSKSESYNGLNMGMALGANLYLPVNKKINLLFGFNNNFGVINIFTKSTSSTNVKSNAFSILGGISIVI